MHAWYGATPEEYETHIRHVLEAEPNIIIDDGGDLSLPPDARTGLPSSLQRAYSRRTLSPAYDVAAALVKAGLEVHAWYGATPEEYETHIRH